MLIFLLITLFFVAGGMAALRIFHVMIADGGMLDELFGYKTMLNNLYEHPVKWKRLLGNALGNCIMCNSFWFQFLWFGLYYGFCRIALDYFPTYEADTIAGKLFVGFVWMLAFNSIGTIVAVISLTRAKMKFKNGVRV